MKKYFMALIFLMLGLSLLAAPSFSANSQSYTIGVYIPAIPGVNVPMDDPNSGISSQEDEGGFQTDFREVTRDGQRILLQTVLMK